MEEKLKKRLPNKGFTGRKHSEETKQKMSQAKLGKVNLLSAEGRLNIIKSQTGRIVSEETRKKISEAAKGRKCSEQTREKLKKRMIENNPMQGRSIYSVWVEKYGQEEANIKYTEFLNKNKDIRLKYAPKGEAHWNYGSSPEDNPMYKKTFYEIWVKKYGVEIAQEKLKNFKEKQKLNNLGSKNSMYGKSPKYSAGLGYAGHYKDWYFRSLLELSYMIKIIERFGLDWESGESLKYRINFNNNYGEACSYKPDFIIENKYMVEIKPKSLCYYSLEKFIEANRFCKQNGYIFKVTRCSYLKKNELLELYNSNIIIFNGRNKERFERYLGI
jgi:hypothetical protein